MSKGFLEKLNKDVLIFDGAMGTRLIALGLDSARAMQYNVEKPDVIESIHHSYVTAGSNVLYSNTFGANRFNLENTGYSVEQVIESAYENVKKASEGRTFLVYSCGPLGKLMYPTGSFRFEEAYECFLEQAKVVATLGFDAVVTETFTDITELRAAILAFRENTDLPILSSMSFDENGRTFAGNSIEVFARVSEGLKVDALGLNCGLGAEKTLKNAEKLSKCTELPIFVKPNAGMPVFSNGVTTYDTNPSGFSSQIYDIVRCVPNVHGVGGCCGTDENYISALSKLEFERAKSTSAVLPAGVCSGQAVVCLDDFIVIGERLNPTGKPLLKKALTELDLDYIYGMCAEQIALGAKIIDVNVGMAGIDEPYVMGEVVEYLSGRLSAPLCIDTTNVDALKIALRRASGVVLINSVNGEQASMNAVLPLADKYGAGLIGLCLDESGISNDSVERIDIANRIINNADNYGIGKDRILIDGLTMSISVDNNNAKRTLDVVKSLSEKGIKTVLGLSNVSFGLPQRERINGVFLRLAKENGLTAAIINPALTELYDDVTEQTLLGYDDGCKRYISAYSNAKTVVDKTKEHTLKECIYFGFSTEGAKRIRELANSENYSKIISEDIIGALNELGDDFGDGKCFLPQLMAGAESARVMLDYIKENFMSSNDVRGAKIILATVKGDIHDIGKNIVKAVLSNYGYEVLDLGRDVSKDEILSAIEKFNPQAVGLSALMTTTLMSMQETAIAIKESFPNVLVLLGGAVVTKEFAAGLGVEYSENAQECVKVLQKFGF